MLLLLFFECLWKRKKKNSSPCFITLLIAPDAVFSFTGNYYWTDSNITAIQLTVEHLKSTAELTYKIVGRQQVTFFDICFEILVCKIWKIIEPCRIAFNEIKICYALA